VFGQFENRPQCILIFFGSDRHAVKPRPFESANFLT
jgi:hypothetical protein